MVNAMSMKILYSHRTKSADGQYVHIRELTDALSARGHSLFLAGPEGAGARADKNLNASDSKKMITMPRALYEVAELAYSLVGYRQLRAQFNAHQPDILYERYNLYYHAGAWLKARTGIPLIMEVNAPLAEERARHGDLSLTSIAQKSQQSIWRAADMVLPVTNVLADHVRALGVPAEKISIIQNGVGDGFLNAVNDQFVRRQFGLGERTILGFTGFVRDWHGVDRVLRYIGENRDKNIHLLLVGDGPARADLEALAAQLGIAHMLTITGVVQRDEMPAYVAAFDIALQPASVAYASPLKLFEYMGLARAIIAPKQANIEEVLTHGTDAYLFDTAVEGAFEGALNFLVEDTQARQRMGQAARASLDRQGLTWARNAARVEAIGHDLLKAKAL